MIATFSLRFSLIFSLSFHASCHYYRAMPLIFAISPLLLSPMPPFFISLFAIRH
jgi:hypothetical protein